MADRATSPGHQLDPRNQARPRQRANAGLSVVHAFAEPGSQSRYRCPRASASLLHPPGSDLVSAGAASGAPARSSCTASWMSASGRTSSASQRWKKGAPGRPGIRQSLSRHECWAPVAGAGRTRHRAGRSGCSGGRNKPSSRYSRSLSAGAEKLYPPASAGRASMRLRMRSGRL